MDIIKRFFELKQYLQCNETNLNTFQTNCYQESFIKRLYATSEVLFDSNIMIVNYHKTQDITKCIDNDKSDKFFHDALHIILTNYGSLNLFDDIIKEYIQSNPNIYHLYNLHKMNITIDKNDKLIRCFEIFDKQEVFNSDYSEKYLSLLDIFKKIVKKQNEMLVYKQVN